MSTPWMKFYPRDWRGDQALRSVSIAARGLWIECLCIMHEAVPYGHLLVNGVPVEGDTLARISGTSADEVSALMAELRQAGVLSMTRKGVVFSRRMVRDHARANKGRKAVKGRWERELAESAPENRAKDGTTGLGQVPDNTSKTSSPNRSPNRSPITQKPEARYSDPNGSGAGAPPAAPEPTEEDPRKALYRRAKQVLGKSSGGQVTKLLKAVSDSIPKARAIIEQASEAGDPAEYVAGAIRKRAPAEPEQVELFDPATRSPDVWRKAVASWRRGGTWAFGHEGPAPNELGTLVPDAILAEFDITPSREPVCNRYEDASQPAVEARYRQMKAAMREKREAMA